VGLEINEWFVSSPIAGGTECPRNLVRIDFFLNNGSDTMLNIEKIGFDINLPCVQTTHRGTTKKSN